MSKPISATKPYQPSQELLDKYAHVLVNYALNGGQGVKPGEVVEAVVPDVAKPLALSLQNVLLQAGAQPIIRLIPTGFERDFFKYAQNDQLTFFPEPFYKAKTELLSHQIGIIADPDPLELQNTDPSKIMLARNARKKYRDWLTEKETKGNFTWTLGLWGVEAKAKIVGLSLKEYWDQIIKACFLDYDDPVAEWRKVTAIQEKMKDTLNEMRILSVHVTGPDADLTVQLGEDRLWQGGSGRNVPSFELFTSPDWRGTEGWIKFNQPVYRYGQVMNGVRLEFKKGLVTKATAEVGENLLLEMLKTPNADKIGEFSLTDNRLSRITHVMAETLFDENISGPHGNTHLAVGMAYRDCYRGDAAALTEEEWATKGYNDSAEHTDIVSTVERTVTATLADGSTQVIYQNGQFTFYKE